MRARLYLLCVLALVFFSSSALADFSVEFEAYTDNLVLETCSCRNIEFPVTVINTGDFDAVYHIAFDGWLAKYSTIAPAQFVLESGKQQKTTVFVRVPCNIKGKFGLKTIIANDMNVVKSFNQHFLVESCSNIDLSVTSEQPESCRCTEFTYEFELQNTGVLEEVYSLDIPLKGADVSLSTDEVTIPGGESKTIKAIVVPPCDMVSRDIKLNIETKYTRQKLSQVLPLVVNASCAAEGYEWAHFNYQPWIIAGLAVLVAIVFIAIIILFIKKRKLQPLERRPSLFKLQLEKPKVKLPWKRIIIIVLILAAIGGAIYLGITHGPAVYAGVAGWFEGEGEHYHGKSMFDIAEDETEEPEVEVEEKVPFDWRLEHHWVYLIVIFSVLAAASLVFYLGDQYKPNKVLRIVKRVVLILLILFVLAVGGYFFYRLLAKYLATTITAIWNFLKLYWLYFVIGVGVLIVLLFLAWLNNKRKSYVPVREIKLEPKELICEFCGRKFKTEQGLLRHTKAKH